MKGWGGAGQTAEVADLYVRNVPTDIRGRMGGVEVEGNSIFVFEVAGLCIGHLGHLHHEPDEGQYAALGRLDVVMAPVDGGLTLPRETLGEVLNRLRSSVVIPMHWFGPSNLEAFPGGDGRGLRGGAAGGVLVRGLAALLAGPAHDRGAGAVVSDRRALRGALPPPPGAGILAPC